MIKSKLWLSLFGMIVLAQWAAAAPLGANSLTCTADTNSRMKPAFLIVRNKEQTQAVILNALTPVLNWTLLYSKAEITPAPATGDEPQIIRGRDPNPVVWTQPDGKIICYAIRNDMQFRIYQDSPDFSDDYTYLPIVNKNPDESCKNAPPPPMPMPAAPSKMTCSEY